MMMQRVIQIKQLMNKIIGNMKKKNQRGGKLKNDSKYGALICPGTSPKRETYS